MATYNVDVTQHVVSKTLQLTVKARSAKEAREKALQFSKDNTEEVFKRFGAMSITYSIGGAEEVR